MTLCLNCGNPESFHHSLSVDDCPGFRDDPTDNEMAQRGPYPLDSRSENDRSL